MTIRSVAALLLALAIGACDGVDDDGSAGASSSAADAGADTLTRGGPGAGSASGSARSRGRSYAELRAEVCDTLTNSTDCARAIEEHRLAETERVTRRGDTLGLALAAGDTARYVDRTGDAADVIYYSYQDYWRDPGWYVVQVQYYEGSEYLLVDDRTGAETRIPNWPLRSPDGRRFAVLSLDLLAGYGPNTLQIWSVDEGEPTLEWETEPRQWGPTAGRWAGAETLELTQRGYCDQLGGEGRDMCDRRARVIHRGGSWGIEPGEIGDGR